MIPNGLETCRQQTTQPCRRDAEWVCAGCGKPVCRAHRFFSELGGRDIAGLRIWIAVCAFATCFALEAEIRLPSRDVSRGERASFFATAVGKRLVGDWDLESVAGVEPTTTHRLE